jgi:tetratricopeptide (TPR) repeat protein
MKKQIWILAILAGAACVPAAVRADMLADIPKAGQLDTRDVELRGDLARLHQKYGTAIADYKLALKAEPHNAVLYNKLGIAYLQDGNHKAARKAFSQSIKYDPYFVNALNNLGAVDCIDKKYNPAIRALKKALALDETNASAHLNMAESWVGLKQIDRAMTEYARALELDADILSSQPDGVLVQVGTPEQRARVDFLIAKAYAKRGNLEGALEYLQRAKDNRFTDMASVYQDPVFTGLWRDPRLQKIVKR